MDPWGGGALSRRAAVPSMELAMELAMVGGHSKPHHPVRRSAVG